MLEQLLSKVVSWLDLLPVEPGVSASWEWVPIVDRESVTATKVIVSPASNTPSASNRGQIGYAFEIDVAIMKPCEGRSKEIASRVVSYALALIERAFAESIDGIPIATIDHPVIIDQETLLQKNIALSVVRLNFRRI